MEQVRRTNKITFTINEVASDVFKISAQAARQKIGQWVNAGACAKIDEVENPGARPFHLYGVTDPRLAIACASKEGLELTLGNILFVCSECEAIIISDRSELICSCGLRSKLENVQSLLNACDSGKNHAK